MWTIFNKLKIYNLTPNECLMLYSVKDSVSCPELNEKELVNSLIDKKFLKSSTELTNSGLTLINDLESYFTKSKKLTDVQIMGKDFMTNVEKYRELFPKLKLPSGKLARQNTKILTEQFRWFFTSFDYDWDTVFKATKMYVNEYRVNNYMYMMTSQYFISKQDKHKVATSTLADYCDMIKEGVSTEEKHFSEKVV